MVEKKTIGISMRVVQTSGYDETRDALAHDWYPFLDWVLADDANWLLIPNLGAEAVTRLLQEQSIEGLILSGGNDLGEYPLRDETELALIQYALDNQRPLIGICRGLQLIWQFFGGKLVRAEAEKHIASRHLLYPTDAFSTLSGIAKAFEVNSYHGQALSVEDRPQQLTVLATTQDQQIEAVRHQQAAIFGLMWHPERESLYAEHDRRLLRSVLLGEQH